MYSLIWLGVDSVLQHDQSPQVRYFRIRGRNLRRSDEMACWDYYEHTISSMDVESDLMTILKYQGMSQKLYDLFYGRRGDHPQFCSEVHHQLAS